MTDTLNNTEPQEQEQKPDFKKLIQERLTEAEQIIQVAKSKLETINDPQTLEKIIAGGVLYFNSTPPAALGKIFKTPEEALIFSTIVAAYFCKSGEHLLNSQIEEQGANLLVPKKSGLILPGQ